MQLTVCMQRFARLGEKPTANCHEYDASDVAVLAKMDGKVVIDRFFPAEREAQAEQEGE